MFEFGRRALVLGAHTDDEFACAGTIARLVESGSEVHLATFSNDRLVLCRLGSRHFARRDSIEFHCISKRSIFKA